MKHFNFSGGEVHVKSNFAIPVVIVTDYTMDGFMALCQYNEIWKRRNPWMQGLDVTYPYFPYARQDRVMEEDEPFSLKVFAEMVNAQNFNSVKIWDPHSDVTPALIDRCRVVPQHDIVRNIVPQELLENCEVVCPDAGAFKKISKIELNPVIAKSHVGLLRVEADMSVTQDVGWLDFRCPDNMLQLTWKDGQMLRSYGFDQIRKFASASL